MLGTLGRQGNPHILTLLQRHLADRGLTEVATFLMSEISPPRLAMIRDVDVFVQVVCRGTSGEWIAPGPELCMNEV